jgi:hypothetical protein
LFFEKENLCGQVFQAIVFKPPASYHWYIDSRLEVLFLSYTCYKAILLRLETLQTCLIVPDIMQRIFVLSAGKARKVAYDL